MEISASKIQSYIDQLMDMTLHYLPKVLLAVIVLFIGFKLAKVLTKSFRTLLETKEIDVSLIPFLTSLVSVAMKILVVLTAISMVGVEVTSFIAVLGAASLAVGLALQGSLSNFAGGVMILIFRPFKVGDVIETQGVIGSVHSIQVICTVLKTFDNKTIILPNGSLATATIINYSTEDTRVVEWVWGIGYGDDIDKAKAIIEEIVFTDARVLDKKEEGYFINLAELGDSSVNFKVRAKVKSEDYWGVFFSKNEEIKKAFDKNGVSIPFPQRDVHIHQAK